MSDLRDALDIYLTIRRALGYKLTRTGLLLADFVGYLEANGTDTITTEASFAWATLPPNLSRATCLVTLFEAVDDGGDRWRELGVEGDALAVDVDGC